MPFGKYKGEDLDDIPTSYLVWLMDNADLLPRLRYAVEETLAMREDDDEPAPHHDGHGRNGTIGECERLRRRVAELEAQLLDARVRLQRAEAGCDAWRENFRELAMTCHPDRGGNHRVMVLLNSINEVMEARGRR